jgi:hypothetical protein
LVALLVITLTSFGGAAFACDPGTPIDPDWVTGAVSVHFGAQTGQASDIARSTDAREVIEPQLTALLMMGDLNASPSGMMVAGADVTLRTWLGELGRSVTFLSETAMHALARSF